MHLAHEDTGFAPVPAPQSDKAVSDDGPGTAPACSQNAADTSRCPTSAPNLNAVRAELVQHRTVRGWSLDTLAKLSGVSRRSLVDLEHGRSAGSLSTWPALAHAFQVPVGHLLGGMCNGHVAPARVAEATPPRERAAS